ncbi:MAG TPA: hypothetical protein VH054_15790, partial [Polyangiaceae bacterium]|nr:hypothetical protein [Polyangiaceae bacterium]
MDKIAEAGKTPCEDRHRRRSDRDPHAAVDAFYVDLAGRQCADDPARIRIAGDECAVNGNVAFEPVERSRDERVDLLRRTRAIFDAPAEARDIGAIDPKRFELSAPMADGEEACGFAMIDPLHGDEPLGGQAVTRRPVRDPRDLAFGARVLEHLEHR